MPFLRIDKADLVGEATDLLIDVSAVEAVRTNTNAAGGFTVILLLASGSRLPLQTNDPDKIVNVIEAG